MEIKNKMEKKKRKDKPEEFDKPETDEDENEIIKLKNKIKNLQANKSPNASVLQLGDIIISTNGNLKVCKRMAEEILKSKPIENYLSFFQKKKLLSSLSYYG